tara:strand:+ start:7893 stop:8144 length:252 start_codon:yes stop_codon:yes gene_type:complete
MFFWNSKKVVQLQERVTLLERQNIALSMTLQNLQSALVVMSKSQESISKDVNDIHTIVTAFLAQIQEASAWYNNFDHDDSLPN